MRTSPPQFSFCRLPHVRSRRCVGVAYTYDGLNRRILKTTQSETREYYYNKNWQCLEEYSNGTLQNSYLWGLRYLDDLICFTPDYTVALTDANFNVVAIANQSGLIERYTYTAFGTRTTLTPSCDTRSVTLYPTLTRTFTGQVFDAETGLMLYRNRVYSPTLGRFSVRDPIGYEGRDNNLYRYVKNSPFVFTDCLGLQFMNGLEGIAGTSNDVSVAIGRSMAEQGQLVKPAPPMAPAHNCTTAICEIQCEKYHHYNIDWRIVHTGVVLDRTMSRGECLKRCQISERLFNEWYTKNLDLSWTTRLPPCPCKLNDRCKEKWEEPTSQLHGFHSGAMKCMRSKPNSEGHANQCCYDTNENLILVGSGQGSCDYGIGEVSLRFLTHFSEDMIPANLADFLDGKKWGCFSEAYLNVRPQIHNCSS